MSDMTLPSASTNTLPPVAKSFYTFCKKCDVDRYHKVLAHKTATSAQIECEVCHSKKTYSLPKASASKSASSSSAGVKRTRVSSESQKKSSHMAEYQTLMDGNGAQVAQDYNIRTKFLISTKLQHPKFGLGFIKSVQPDKIEVVFSDEVKILVHNRQ